MMDEERTDTPTGWGTSDHSVIGGPGGVTRIGRGDTGGKAQGLIGVKEHLNTHFDSEAFPPFRVYIPHFIVVSTDMFDLFMEQNRLYDLALSGARDCHIASAFQKSVLPDSLVDVLRELIANQHCPLAVRSSSLLEDALQEPFAGVYATKMVPNNQFSAEARLRTLVEAVKYVYASTFLGEAKSYRRAVNRSDSDEKMAVIIQEVVGMRHGDRFYPTISGVARSRNFYPVGHARPEEGVVSLAFGLGKTIVDGGRSWTYCPAYPKVKPPFASVKELLNQTQTRFWCVNMGRIPTYDATQETEYLCEGDLQEAEEDGVLPAVASTYDPQSDRIVIGVRSPGPRVLTFGPLLELNTLPLNDLVVELLSSCEERFGKPVEIEFAVNLSGVRDDSPRLGFLQVRPMLVSHDQVEVSEQELHGESVVVSSKQVLGNGRLESIRDIVYVKPDAFSAKDSWLVAAELADMNRLLLEEDRPYLLVAIGRLGSSDPWLGIPVKWGQVSGAKAVVEVSTADMNVDMSQGSHFFHNVTNLKVLYFSAGRSDECRITWDWLESREVARDGPFVRHVTLDEPLHIKVDGKSGRGVICHEGEG